MLYLHILLKKLTKLLYLTHFPITLGNTYVFAYDLYIEGNKNI